MEAQPIKPAAWVPERFFHSSPTELLLTDSVTIRMQTLMNKRPLALGEELGRVGIVLNEPICCDSHNDRGDTFLDMGQPRLVRRPWTRTHKNKDPSPSILPNYA